jgi:hypothetical protein
MNFGRFIWRGPVSGIADLYGFHATPRRDLEFTGVQVGRFVGLGFLRAKARTSEAQRRFPPDSDLSPYKDYDVKDDDPAYPSPALAFQGRPKVIRAQDPPQSEPSSKVRRAQDPPRSEDML